MRQSALSLACLLLGMTVLGCGGGGAGQDSTFSASGKLTGDDKPYGPATLTLASTDKDGKKPSIQGNVDKDGNIKYVTYGKEGVVAAGTYSVTMAGDIMTMATVPATEPGTVEIKAGGSSVDVKLKSIPGAPPVGGIPLPKTN